ncbi:ribonuclease-III-like-domain-containing protein [Lasiosphaeria hispida]|uniref:Ribonuclease-III-like-domain-containing protein n=1 Tax=Lasiosphaeria hispida TaxID=260671 RepID=A0AAJ0MIL3_9PEZI|nr:ribonuclease-III-like-domain-containing protein [Lasiosphaeria hispida]
MALNPSRSLSSTCKVLRQCRPSALTAAPVRPFSSTIARSFEYDAEPEQNQRPRWSYTPEKMKGPGFSINIVKDPRRKEWSCNEDPAVLDAMYNRLLGPQGEKMLPDEIKWLAITHKSFDQGRRGFNTRLAYYGRHILAFEATRSILVSPAGLSETVTPDAFNRTHFSHPALASADKLSNQQPQEIIQKEKMAKLAVEIGLPEVLRWKPRLPENLEGSGLTVVLNQTLYAIIGAISLQHGAEVAHKVARERFLRRLGA